MADHAEFQIVNAIKGILVSASIVPVDHVDIERLAETYTDRDFDRRRNNVRINLQIGPDEPELRDATIQDSLLTVYTTLVHRADVDAGNWAQRMSNVRRDIHQAILADRQLGLPSLVITTELGTTDEAEIMGESTEFRVITRRSAWLVHYRTLLVDPTRSS